MEIKMCVLKREVLELSCLDCGYQRDPVGCRQVRGRVVYPSIIDELGDIFIKRFLGGI